MPNRHKSTDDYRYGFQGQEKDNELKGEGNSLNYTFRMHDPRVGRFFAVDPLFKEYPELTPYQFSSNSPIDMIEIEGKEGGYVVDDQYKVSFRSGPIVNSFESEDLAKFAATNGIRTPEQLNSYLDWLARTPKIQKTPDQLRCACGTCLMNSDNQFYLGGRFSIGGGIGYGINIMATDFIIGKALIPFFSFLRQTPKVITLSEVINPIANVIQKTTVNLEKVTVYATGSNEKFIVIGRNMESRILPLTEELSQNGIKAEAWTGFDKTLSNAENLANNKAWIQSKLDDGYSVIDAGLDPKYTAKGNFDKGEFYQMEIETVEAFQKTKGSSSANIIPMSNK